MSGANSWLARQRKSDLVDLAQSLGFTEYAPLPFVFIPPLLLVSARRER